MAFSPLLIAIIAASSLVVIAVVVIVIVLVLLKKKPNTSASTKPRTSEEELAAANKNAVVPSMTSVRIYPRATLVTEGVNSGLRRTAFTLEVQDADVCPVIYEVDSTYNNGNSDAEFQLKLQNDSTKLFAITEKSEEGDTKQLSPCLNCAKSGATYADQVCGMSASAGLKYVFQLEPSLATEKEEQEYNIVTWANKQKYMLLVDGADVGAEKWSIKLVPFVEGKRSFAACSFIFKPLL
jgi:hypothetical protein